MCPLCRYFSIAGDAVGGYQVLFFLKGCSSVGGVFLKNILSCFFCQSRPEILLVEFVTV